MKVPFRQQVCDFDCVPTTFVNALLYLFDRDEIPPVVLQRIYLYCLDSIDFRGGLARGTTNYGIRLLSSWMTDYRYRRFRVECTYLEGANVDLGARSEITKCLRDQRGVVLMNVKHFGTNWHYILALNQKDEWIRAYDPCPKSEEHPRTKTSGS